MLPRNQVIEHPDLEKHAVTFIKLYQELGKYDFPKHTSIHRRMGESELKAFSPIFEAMKKEVESQGIGYKTFWID